MSAGTPIRVGPGQESDYAFRITFDDAALAPLLADEPAPLGHDRGPNPARLLLASLANFLAARLLFALRKHRNAPGPLRAHISALPSRNEHGRWRTASARATVHLPGHDADYRNLDRVPAQSEDFCIVTQSVRRGVAVAVDVVDCGGRVLSGDRDSETGP